MKIFANLKIIKQLIMQPWRYVWYTCILLPFTWEEKSDYFPEHGSVDLGVRDGVQFTPLFGVRENDLPEHFSVYRLVLVQNLVPEIFLDFVPRWFIGFHHWQNEQSILYGITVFIIKLGQYLPNPPPPPWITLDQFFHSGVGWIW